MAIDNYSGEFTGEYIVNCNCQLSIVNCQLSIDMKYILSLCILLGASALSAQTDGGGQVEDIIDALQERVPGKGTVTVRGSDALRNMLGKRLHGEGVEKTDSAAFLKIQGYRTQVFSGNNQRKSKDEAFRKEKEIKELFPDVPTYVTYNAPFWRLRIGDFRSHEEAYHMQRLLMDAFPAYRKEMYIVREEVKIPLN